MKSRKILDTHIALEALGVYEDIRIAILSRGSAGGGGGSHGAVAFTELTDVPSTYGGQGGKFLRVKLGENGLEFADNAVSTNWGDIGGTITDQTDLQTTLTGYALLAGRSGGQTLKGGTGVTDILKLQGTSGNGTAGSPAVQTLVGNNGGTVAMTVLNNGNVGIGETNPGAKLQVNTGSTTTIGQIIKGAVSQTANLTEWWNSSGTALTVVDENGWVGVGIAIPTFPVHVASIAGAAGVVVAPSTWTGNDSGFYFNSSHSGSGTLFALNINATSSGSVNVQIKNNGTGTAASVLWAAGTGDAYNYWLAGSEWSAGVDNSDSDKFKIGPNSDPSTGTPGIAILTGGNVGIGTASPAAKLDVAGDIFPTTDNTYYIGKNDDDSPKAWKGVILKDQTTGTYYRVQIDSGALTLIDLTD